MVSTTRAWQVLLLSCMLGRVAMIPINVLLNTSAAVSPACKRAMEAIPPTSFGWEEANFASGEIVEGFTLLVKKLFRAKNLLQLVGNVPVTDMGGYDQCMGITDGSYHFCDIHLKEDKPLIRWGVCLPQGCDGDDVIKALVPPGFRSDFLYLCDGVKANRGRVQAMTAVIMLLLTCIVVATGMDARERSQASAQAPNKAVGGEERKDSAEVEQEMPTLRTFGIDSSGWMSRFSISGIERPACSALPLWPPLSGVLSTFSAYRSLGALMQPRTGPFSSLDGIRALAMLHIIYGHSFLIPLGGGYTNLDYALDGMNAKNRFQPFVVRSALMSVATFFLLSGFMGANSICRHLTSSQRRIGDRASNKAFLRSYPLLIAMRWLRLVPLYAFVLASYLILGPVISQGPSTHIGLSMDLRNCKAQWWQSLLFFSNMTSDWLLRICFPWSWYLDVDFQLWLTAPLFLLVAFNYPRVGYGLGIAVCLASMVYTGVLTKQEELTVNLFNRKGNFNRYFGKIYIKPQSRLTSFYLGVLLGLIWFRHGEQIAPRGLTARHKAKWVSAMVLVGGLLLAVPTFWAKGVVTAKGEIWPTWEMATYIALADPMWVSGIASLSLLTILKLGGPINTLLESHNLLVLSRLSFGAYLIHPALLNIYSANLSSPGRFFDLSHWITALGISGLSYALAAVAFMMVEYPSQCLVKFIGDKATGAERRKKSLPEKTLGDAEGVPPGRVADGV